MTIIDDIRSRQAAEMTQRAERAERFIRDLPCLCPHLAANQVGLCPRCDFLYELDRRDGR